MKKVQITKFQASDGRQFNTETECQLYEDQVLYLKRIIAFMGESVGDCEFQNGEGYIQHDIEKIKQARKEFTILANHKHGTSYGFGFIGRVLDDSGDDLFYSAWGRLSCVDANGREWGQAFYANNPTEGKQVEYHSHA